MDEQFTSLVEALRRRARETRNKVAFVFPDGTRSAQQLTYGELQCRAADIAARLAQQACTGEPVLICQAPGVEYVCSLFGCLLAGVAAVPAHPPRLNQKFDRLSALAEDAGARLMLTSATMREQLRPAFRTVPGLTRLSLIASDGCDADRAAVRLPETEPETLAVLQYTSGSTGRPKGVMLSHENLAANVRTIAEAFELGPDSRGVIWLPPYHDMGLVGGLLTPPAVGFPVALLSPFKTLQRPVRWLEAVDRFGATISGGPSFAYEMCVRRLSACDASDLDLSRWSVAFCGAEPVRASVLQRFASQFASRGFRRESFAPCYGLAESTLMATSVPRGTGCVTCRPDALPPGCSSHPLVSCGYPRNGHQMAVVDPDSRRACPEGVVGEVWLSGPSIAQGYWNKPLRSEATFGMRLVDDRSRVWLRTGDLGLIRGGDLFLAGRRDNVLIVRGRNHIAEDIEQTVADSHPSLKPARTAVVAVEQEWTAEVAIVQEVVRRTSDADALAALRAIRANVLHQHAIDPLAICLVAEHHLPVTSSGKIRRTECLDLFKAGRLSERVRLDRRTHEALQA